MSPPDDIERPASDRLSGDRHDEIRMLALAMERMATEMATLKSQLDRSESLLEAIANRTAVLASRHRPQAVTKEDLLPVLTGLLNLLERHDRSAGDGHADRP